MGVVMDNDQAAKIVQDNIPDGEIQASALYNGKWLFSVFTDDGVEGDLDPFYAVDETSGAFSGFSITGDEDIEAVIEAFNASITHSEFLAHYGVKGMKWGKRKAEDSSSGGTGSGASKTGPSTFSKNAETTLNVVKPLAGMFVPTANLRQKAMQVSAIMAQGAGQVTLKAAMKTSFLSPAAIAGYIVSAADSGAYRVPPMVVKNSIRGGWPTKRELAKVPMSVEEIQSKVIKDINPQYPGLGTTNNCLRATYTYEMRRRGFDVAATKTMMASGQSIIGTHVMTKSMNVGTKIEGSPFKKGDTRTAKVLNAFFKIPPTASQTFAALSKQPNGSRGDLQMSWGPLMGGHSVAYEIIGGKPVVFDTQSGKTYSTPKELNKLTIMAQSMKFNRLDDKNLNDFAMAAWIKDAASARHSALEDFISQYGDWEFQEVL